jgi:glycosyltransferase involved in cell wall biosynthesis
MFPLVSVIIPTYNRKNIVSKAIDSVLSQTYTNYEIIVVDDGSTDQTEEALQPYLYKIKYIYQENKGVSAARNTGIRNAKGEWIAFLDSDDQWLSGKLHMQVRIINNSKLETGCIICNMKFNPQIGKISNSFQSACFTPKPPQGMCQNMTSILLTRFIMFNQGAIIKKDILNRIGGFNEQLTILEDYDLALKLSFLCDFGYEATPLVVYHRDTKDSLSSNIKTFVEIKQIINILENLTTFLDDNEISIPKLLNRQIKFHKFQLKFCNKRFLSFSLKIIKAIFRRSPFFPKPNCVAIVFKES